MVQMVHCHKATARIVDDQLLSTRQLLLSALEVEVYVNGTQVLIGFVELEDGHRVDDNVSPMNVDPESGFLLKFGDPPQQRMVTLAPTCSDPLNSILPGRLIMESVHAIFGLFVKNNEIDAQHHHQYVSVITKYKVF